MCSRGSWIQKLRPKLSPTSRGLTRAPASHQAKLYFPSLVLSCSSNRRTHEHTRDTRTQTRTYAHSWTYGHAQRPGHKRERARADKRARAPVHTCTPARRPGYAGTHKHTRAPTQKCFHSQGFHPVAAPSSRRAGVPVPCAPPPRRTPTHLAPVPASPRPARAPSRRPRGQGAQPHGRPGPREGSGQARKAEAGADPSRVAMRGRYASWAPVSGSPRRSSAPGALK